MKDSENIREIGGKTFRLMENGTLEHDIWMMQIAHSIGMDRLGRQAKEKDEDFAVRLHWLVLESGRSFDILGGILVPAAIPDAGWTPELALQTSAFMKGLKEPEQKKRAQDALVEFNCFFAKGLLSSALSRIASMGSRPEANPASDQIADESFETSEIGAT